MSVQSSNKLSTKIRRLTFASILLTPTFASATTVGPVLQLATPNADQRSPALSWDGTQYVIVWEDNRNEIGTGVDLYIARVAPDGTLSDSDGIALLENAVLAGDQIQPTIVYNPTSAVHFVAWTSDGDIYTTRFLPGSGSTVPSGGTLVTSYPAAEMNSDAESFPDIACTSQSCLIVYQSVLTGGGGRTRIRGRRLFPDGVNFADTRPLELVDNTAGAFFEAGASVLNVGSTFFVGWHDDRTGDNDPYLRTLPELTPVGVEIGIPMVVAPMGQSKVSLRPLGAGNFLAVWEDGRLMMDDNIAGQRFNSIPAAVGGPLSISAALNDQKDPEFSGDDNGGLVIWQDRRNGNANGITYGARMDPSGNILDPDGFPILFYDMNSFEHAVVKGPGSDYLVASVRFDPAVTRIFYRVVRDEDPDGMMTATAPASVPADGVTTADFVFAPAQGASGLPVVDGTLYTVVVDNPNVTVEPADVDPVLPGHQIGAVMGTVNLTMRTTDHSMVGVSVTSVDGASVGAGSVVFDNVPPVASLVQIGPNMPRSNVDLSLSYTYDDINGDLENGTLIQWSKNSAIQGNLMGLTVPAIETARGDVWRARVTPRDGLDNGTSVFSNELNIGNTPPEALMARIDPDMDVRTGVGIRARYIFEDADRDGEGPSEIRWFDRGNEQAALMDQSDLDGSLIVKGQVWQFTVLPNDGIENGPLATSGMVSVINTAPVADAGDEGMVLERRPYTLDGTRSADNDPQDSLTYAWTQIQGPEVQLSDTSSATPSFTAPSVLGSNVLRFELIVSDGEEDSQPSAVLVRLMPVDDDDNDGLDNEEEAEAGTNPAVQDTDRDGLSDREEVMAMLNPLDQDSDDDGVRDGAEGQMCRNCDADPLSDLDNDMLINAIDPDTDNDGLFDGTELGISDPLPSGGMAPYEYGGTDETVGNFVADEDPLSTTDPLVADTDLDTFADGVEDANGNGRIDTGESDPNDPTDPGIDCPSGNSDCPTGFYCGSDGVCLPGAGPDGGMMCMPLQENLECCMGGCSASGTLVDPVCPSSGAREQCPIGADQCGAGSCSMPEPTPPPMGSCGCASREPSPTDNTPGLWLFLLFGLRFTSARRRSADRS